MKRQPTEEELEQHLEHPAELQHPNVDTWPWDAARRFAVRVGELEAELAVRDYSAPETDWTYLRVDLIKAVLKAGVLDARQAVRDTAMIEAYCRTGQLPAELPAETEADE